MNKQQEDLKQSVIFSENYPILHSGTEKSYLNRFQKYLKTIGDHQWISEMDLFNVPFKMNFKGQDSGKTQFGGLIVFMIGIFSLFVTGYMLFQNGISFQTQVQTSAQKVFLPQTDKVDVFQQTDTLLQIMFYDKTTDQKITDPSAVSDINMYSIVNGEPTLLELSTDCSMGIYCLKKSQTNQKISIFESDGQLGYLSLQIMTCATLPCSPLSQNTRIIIGMTNFNYQTNRISSRVDFFEFTKLQAMSINVQKIEYKTNNIFFGMIANVLAKTIPFYYYQPQPTNLLRDQTFQYVVVGANYQTDCFITSQCSYMYFVYDKTLIEANQIFIDLTAPILLFLSLNETLAFLAWLLFLRNYSNNALHLRIADTLVYIPKQNQTHYDFKPGFWSVLICLFYNHPTTQLFNKLLFKCCQTDVIRLLPLKAQLLVRMIDYGQQCLEQSSFFGNLNGIYDLQNIRPTKIIPYSAEPEPKQQKQAEQQDQNKKYFNDEIEQEAFRRLCNDHEHYSVERKEYLSSMLKDKNKKHKLVLLMQEMFKKYKIAVDIEKGSIIRQIPIPLCDQNSANEMLPRIQMN